MVWLVYFFFAYKNATNILILGQHVVKVAYQPRLPISKFRKKFKNINTFESLRKLRKQIK